ncbi:sensor domain-containing diguanylate cyclase [Vibrio litoralis]|uniref:sensor domain-containing diguanylate cyclase n=1 Tax=Vibrio litoralis TaxID=335972 RepID=UPI00040C8954|nr:sensor domain-containing diguanylate cyclase [Vibrio litoralis]
MTLLDNRTLLVAVSLITIGAAIVLTILWWIRPKSTGVGHWALGILLIGVGCMSSVLRGHIDMFFSVVVVNTIIVLGMQLIFHGLRIFTERKSFIFYDVAVTCITAALFYYFFYIDPSLTIRTILYSFLVGMVSVAIVFTLLTDQNKIRRKSSYPIAIIFGLFAFFHIMRGIMEMIAPSGKAPLDGGTAETLLYLSSIFIISGLAITLVLQTYFILESKLQSYLLAVENSASSIMIVNRDWIIEYANPESLKKTGYRKEELVGGSIDLLHSKEVWVTDIPKILQCLEGGETWRGQLYSKKKNGEQFWELASIAPMVRATGNVTHYVAIKEDITDIKKAKQRIHYMASHDMLTGLPNRTMAMEYLNNAIKYPNQGVGKVAVLFVDLDGFKAVNDSYGHNAGDELLKIISSRLLHCVRDKDLVSRRGGDEFLILLRGAIDKDVISMVAQRMIEAIAKPVEFNGHLLMVTASIGISLYPDNSQDSKELITLADQAMYNVKHSGKSNFLFVSES